MASCGDQQAVDGDALANAMFDGDLEQTDRMFEASRPGGEWRQVLILLQFQLTRMESIRAALDGGSNLEQAFRAAKPPVFFGQQKSMERQISIFSSSDLAAIQYIVQTAMLASRQSADLAEASSSRALLTIARLSRQFRQRNAR